MSLWTDIDYNLNGNSTCGWQGWTGTSQDEVYNKVKFSTAYHHPLDRLEDERFLWSDGW